MEIRRAQGYDGANTMSGVYSGVQSRIKQLEKNAVYVHCAARLHIIRI